MKNEQEMRRTEVRALARSHKAPLGDAQMSEGDGVFFSLKETPFYPCLLQVRQLVAHRVGYMTRAGGSVVVIT
jgi:hypothetical protein